MFYRQSSARDSLTSDCRACRNARVKSFRVRNAERISERRKNAYRVDPEKYIKRTLEWQRNNPEKMKAKAKRWGAKESARVKKLLTRQRRIARVAAAFVPESEFVTAEWFSSVIERQGGSCVYCGASADLEMEHVEPISRGGLHVRENIVAACGSCNSSKGAKFLLEWRMGR